MILYWYCERIPQSVSLSREVAPIQNRSTVFLHFWLYRTNIFFLFSLRATRHKVWAARQISPLFDCKQYAEGLEMLYARMWERFAMGLKPDHVKAIADK